MLVAYLLPSERLNVHLESIIPVEVPLLLKKTNCNSFEVKWTCLLCFCHGRGGFTQLKFIFVCAGRSGSVILPAGSASCLCSVDRCNWRKSDGHLLNFTSCNLSPNGQESLMERVGEGWEWKDIGKKNCLGCKMGPFINNNGSSCIPTGGGDSWNFYISKGASKAAETGHFVSPDPIREQWSMRPAEKMPEWGKGAT